MCRSLAATSALKGLDYGSPIPRTLNLPETPITQLLTVLAVLFQISSTDLKPCARPRVPQYERES